MASGLVQRLTSPHEWVRMVEVKHPDGMTHTEMFLTVSNLLVIWKSSLRPFQSDDLKTVGPEKRTWGTWNFVALYVCELMLHSIKSPLRLYNLRFP